MGRACYFSFWQFVQLTHVPPRDQFSRNLESIFLQKIDNHTIERDLKSIQFKKIRGCSFQEKANTLERNNKYL